MHTQSGWTRLLTPTGRYEYQFQGSGPAVRNGTYENAGDYQFLVLDEEGLLYRIPVRVTAGAEEELRRRNASERVGERGRTIPDVIVSVAEAQLRAGLARFKPRLNVAYPELDVHFSVDEARAGELVAGES